MHCLNKLFGWFMHLKIWEPLTQHIALLWRKKTVELRRLKDISKNTELTLVFSASLQEWAATVLLRTRFFMMAVIKAIKRKPGEDHATLKSHGAGRWYKWDGPDKRQGKIGIQEKVMTWKQFWMIKTQGTVSFYSGPRWLGLGNRQRGWPLQ